MFKPFMRRKTTGATTIIRDNYGKYWDSWRDISKQVKNRDGNKCVLCGGIEGLEPHHITPLSKGGKTVMSNLLTMCKTCHDRRHPHLVVGRKSRTSLR